MSVAKKRGRPAVVKQVAATTKKQAAPAPAAPKSEMAQVVDLLSALVQGLSSGGVEKPAPTRTAPPPRHAPSQLEVPGRKRQAALPTVSASDLARAESDMFGALTETSDIPDDRFVGFPKVEEVDPNTGRVKKVSSDDVTSRDSQLQFRGMVQARFEVFANRIKELEAQIVYLHAELESNR